MLHSVHEVEEVRQDLATVVTWYFAIIYLTNFRNLEILNTNFSSFFSCFFPDNRTLSLLKKNHCIIKIFI